MAPTVLITGASGFVGRAVVTAFSTAGWAVRASTRQLIEEGQEGVNWFQVSENARADAWQPALHGVDTVVHCAARVHVMREAAADPLAAFRRANTAATLDLAHAAQGAGVRRFIFMSTIGVNGARTGTRPFSSTDKPAPHSPYAVSKLEGETALGALNRQSGIEVVVIRPPLVYGAGAPGNFGKLVRAVQAGLPLPLGAVNNKRSLVAVDNLASLIVACATHAAAPGQTFLASDGQDLSTTELLWRLGEALGRTARLIPVPVALLLGAARVLGRTAMVEQLCGNLQVDSSPARSLLGWTPPLTLAQGLAAVAGRDR